MRTSPIPCLAQDYSGNELLHQTQRACRTLYKSTRAWEGSDQDNTFIQQWKSALTGICLKNPALLRITSCRQLCPTQRCLCMCHTLHAGFIEFTKPGLLSRPLCIETHQKNKAGSCTREFSVSELLKYSHYL